MLSIVYSSAAARQFTSDDLAALLAQSRATNEQHDLTGLLVHRDGRFLQLIEGPEHEVRARMAAIEGDGRHGHVRVLLEDEIDERRFPEWTMGFESADGARPRSRATAGPSTTSTRTARPAAPCRRCGR